MNINRSELLAVLKSVLPGTDSSVTILEGSDSIIFSDGNIYSYNDTISISIPFPFKDKDGNDISGAVKAKEFYDVISKLSSETIKLIPKSDSWIISSGKNIKTEFVLLESNIMQNIKNIFPAKIKWSAIPEKFIDGISYCSFSGNRSQLAGIFVSNNIVTSTNEIRINWYTMESNINGAFWISDYAVSELLKLDKITKYCISDAWIHFKTEKGITFSCKRLAQEKYPFEKMKVLIENNKKEKGDISNELPSELNGAIDRASALSQNIESFDTVKLTITNEGIEVFSKRPSGKYTENVEWGKVLKISIEPISIFVDHLMIENAIKNSTSFYLKKAIIKDKEVIRIVLKSENGIQLISTFNEE
jgi:hypothetical protein